MLSCGESPSVFLSNPRSHNDILIFGHIATYALPSSFTQPAVAPSIYGTSLVRHLRVKSAMTFNESYALVHDPISVDTEWRFVDIRACASVQELKERGPMRPVG